MDIAVTGRNIDVGDALTSHVHDHLDGAVSKYFGQALDAQVSFSHEGPMLRADISVHPGPRGLVVQGTGSSEDPYAAFDSALERIAKQLRRYKRRLNDHHRGRDTGEVLAAQQYVIQSDEQDDAAPVGDDPVIIAEMPTAIATLSVSEAVMRLDLADAPVLMFRNSGSDTLNVVYRRADGNIGWIDPADGKST